MKRKYFLIILLIIIIITVLLASSKDKSENLITIANSFSESFLNRPNLFTTQITPDKTDLNDKDNKEKQLPAKVSLNVPFIKQAPFANWDDDHNDACEEASVIAVVKYREGLSSYSDEDSEKDIQALISWQIENFGGHYDLPIDKVVEMTLRYYNYQTQTFLNKEVNLENIKKQLAQNNPIIVPLAGRLINNPYYRSPGPIYHMLVISGYDESSGKFITQDPGTKRGKDYEYPYSTIIDAIHDISIWKLNKTSLENNQQAVLAGTKSMLVIKSKKTD